MPTTIDYLNLLKQNDTSNRTISFLYNKCLRIAITTVAKKYSKTNQKFFGIDATVESIATDAIITLFTSSKPKEPIGLLKSLLSWENTIKKEEDADFFIHKIVWSRVAQYIARILKDSDPFFKIIHASLKHYIEKNNYNKLVYFGVIFITEPQNESIYGKVISNEEAENLPDALFFCRREEIFENVFRYLETNTDFFPAIPLNALVRKLKHIKWNEHINVNDIPSSPLFVEIMDIENIINKSLVTVYKNLEDSYKRSNKLDDKVVNAYKLTLKDIAEDLRNGTISRGLYEYLNVHLSGLSKDKFYDKYHSQLNYLITLLKKSIAEQIKLN